MPYTSAQNFKEILTALSVLRYVLKSSGKAGTTDAYKHSENFFKTVLNLTYDLQLQDMNKIQANYPAIDLGDAANKVCFQITGENSSTKIKKTLKGFFEIELDKTYSQLRVLILTGKKDYTANFPVSRGFVFTPDDDIMDIDDLLGDIESRSPETIAKIHAFVTSELSSIVKLFASSDSLLSKIEPRIQRPPTNAKRLLKYLSPEPEEIEGIKKALAKGYASLTNLSKVQREVIYLILDRGSAPSSGPYGSRYVHIPISTLRDIVSMPVGDLDAIVDAIIDQRLMHYTPSEEDHGAQKFYLTWPFGEFPDFFEAFREMFENEEDQLKALIVYGDFSLLDE